MKDPVPRARSAPNLLTAILQDAGVSTRSAVRVTGKGGLAPLIWLCRHGFDDVAYVHYDGGGPRDPADVLLILANTPPAELEHLLDEHPRLREGGVLIVQTPALRTADGQDPIHLILERAGYRVERCIPHRSREVHIARRQFAADRRHAA